MTRPANLRRGLLAVLMTLPLLFAACSSGSDDASPGGADGATENPVDDGAGDQADDEGDTEDEGDTDDDDAAACDLLSDEEVSEHIGYEVLSKEGDAMGLPTCEWMLDPPSPDEAMAMPSMLTLVVLPTEGDFEARMRGRGSQGAYEDVDDVGEKANLAFVESPDGNGAQMAQLLVWDGDQGMYLSPSSVIWDGKDDARDALMELTQTALDRL